MRWSGWGTDAGAFDPELRPYLLPFLRDLVGLADERVSAPPQLADVRLPEPVRVPAFLAAAADLLGAERLRTDRLERVLHACGRSYRDLFRLRHGGPVDAPDAVLYPETTAEVAAIVALAERHRVALVPFGGGSNIAGCLEVQRPDRQMVVSVDMGLMDAVLALDPRAATARIQAGARGQRLEEQLRAEGFSLGHFPDSFLHSTLGGWVATRSSGMLSDTYGNIEDMVVALSVVTPRGLLETRAVPRSSSGPQAKDLVLGSEGTLGIITEVTVRIRPLAERRRLEGWLFPSFEAGLEAMRTCRQRGEVPLLARLNDPLRTRLSAAFRKRSSGWAKGVQAAYLGWLGRIRRFPLDRACLMIVGFEGTAATVRARRRAVGRIYRAVGAVPLGTGPGRSFEEAKFDFPYARDFLMDYGVMGDVSETATSWSNAVPLYRATTTAIEAAIRATGARPFVGCHASHSYRDGVSLYFTFGCMHGRDDPLGQYDRIKAAAQDAMLAAGGTLSHHHAVGVEHAPWLARDVGPLALAALAGAREQLDPNGIMNPGKLRPTAVDGAGPTTPTVTGGAVRTGPIASLEGIPA